MDGKPATICPCSPSCRRRGRGHLRPNAFDAPGSAGRPARIHVVHAASSLHPLRLGEAQVAIAKRLTTLLPPRGAQPLVTGWQLGHVCCLRARVPWPSMPRARCSVATGASFHWLWELMGSGAETASTSRVWGNAGPDGACGAGWIHQGGRVGRLNGRI